MDSKKLLQSGLVKILDDLTKQKNVYWFRRSADNDLVYCHCFNDILKFELSDGTEENNEPLYNTHGIILKFRNISLLWLEGIEDWDLLIGLIRNSRVDDSKLYQASGDVLVGFVEELEMRKNVQEELKNDHPK